MNGRKTKESLNVLSVQCSVLRCAFILYTPDSRSRTPDERKKWIDTVKHIQHIHESQKHGYFPLGYTI